MKKLRENKVRNPYIEDMLHLKGGRMKSKEDKRKNNKNMSQEFMKEYEEDNLDKSKLFYHECGDMTTAHITDDNTSIAGWKSKKYSIRDLVESEIDRAKKQKIDPYKDLIPPPNCICNKALLLYVPPGKSVQCPCHPWAIYKSSLVSW